MYSSLVVPATLLPPPRLIIPCLIGACCKLTNK
nr:MAG TPA: hypothetical protein [Caudoviricetes sp.]